MHLGSMLRRPDVSLPRLRGRTPSRRWPHIYHRAGRKYVSPPHLAPRALHRTSRQDSTMPLRHRSNPGCPTWRVPSSAHPMSPHTTASPTRDPIVASNHWHFPSTRVPTDHTTPIGCSVNY
ncbi:uncharacterized protein BDZ83DRAFT_43614 [Colletotrichum acutatum]|uniref:Uncharacterized protein n=1 Tax=Glomerella acutata TaxID=27357 RepID=A0AAD8XAH0_GLOAC|nr:uncharacterized protein BDZ83DRAFT_43614 [Colletotrichum acutatum]KAK1716125.1 hypothetical protein BDZ83DRAFT_43614 [Colletotrichum acutatum]